MSSKFEPKQYYMGYSQSRKLTSTEKRLKSLRTQLYGKEEVTTALSKPSGSTSFKFTPFKKEGEVKVAAPKIESSDSKGTYLKQDLMKIFFLALLAIGAEFLIYLGINRGLVKF